MPLLPHEKIQLRTRKHPVVFFIGIIPYLFLCVLPPIISLVLSAQEVELPENDLFLLVLTLAGSAYYLWIFLLILYTFFIHFLDEWIITDESLVDIQQKGLFSRVVAKEELDKIQDITVEVKGFVPTLFNYGDIFVQTAGSAERFSFRAIPNPHDVMALTSNLIKKRDEKIIQE